MVFGNDAVASGIASNEKDEQVTALVQGPGRLLRGVWGKGKGGTWMAEGWGEGGIGEAGG